MLNFVGTCIKLGRAKAEVGEACWETGRTSFSSSKPSSATQESPISKQDQERVWRRVMDPEIPEISGDRLPPGSRFSAPSFLILKNLLLA